MLTSLLFLSYPLFTSPSLPSPSLPFHPLPSPSLLDDQIKWEKKNKKNIISIFNKISLQFLHVLTPVRPCKTRENSKGKKRWVRGKERNREREKESKGGEGKGERKRDEEVPVVLSTPACVCMACIALSTSSFSSSLSSPLCSRWTPVSLSISLDSRTCLQLRRWGEKKDD